MRVNLGKNAPGIVIVGNADRTDIDGIQRIRERQFQHHYPLRCRVECKGAMFILNRGW